MGRLSTLTSPTAAHAGISGWQPPVGITLNDSSSAHHLIAPFGMQNFSYMPRFAMLSTHPPTPSALATFSAALAEGLASKGATVSELVNGSSSSVQASSELLNRSDIAVIQHDCDVYGGPDGDELVQIMDGLRVASIVIVHTVLKDPTPHQHSVLERVVTLADQVVVMSAAAGERLCADYTIDQHKVVTIPPGAAVPTSTAETWPVVADAYLALARRLVAARLALT
jgi:hypothetical protein